MRMKLCFLGVMIDIKKISVNLLHTNCILPNIMRRRSFLSVDNVVACSGREVQTILDPQELNQGKFVQRIFVSHCIKCIACIVLV